MAPQIGTIVHYRSQADVVMAAIVTGEAADGGVHLEIFAPPGRSRDILNHTFGALEGDGRGEWRLP